MEKKTTNPSSKAAKPASPKTSGKPPREPRNKTGKTGPKPLRVPDVEIPDRTDNPEIRYEGLSLQQSEFVRQFVIDFNGTQAAIRAGYSERSAYAQACELLKKHEVQAAIRKLLEKHAEKMDLTVEDLVRRWRTQLEADHNELTQFRRNCCRHCWGEDFGYQYTPGEFEKARIRHEEKRAELLGKSGGKSDIGPFPGRFGDWYDKRRDPNPNCPDCFGEGIGEVFIADTRRLSDAGKTIYAGVKQTKEGIEVKTVSSEKAGEYLARHLGAFNDKLNVEVADISAEALEEKYVAKMRAARERQAQVAQERGDRG